MIANWHWYARLATNVNIGWQYRPESANFWAWPDFYQLMAEEVQLKLHSV